jgi:hypothetical protein
MGAPLSFLHRPLRREELFAELDELRDGEFVFFAVLEVSQNGDFLADHALAVSLNKSHNRGKHDE